MSKPIISVIVPVFNTEKYLENCVISIIGQSFKEIEIVLVNDGSTDGSGEVADRCAQRYDNVKVIHNDNCGAAEARLIGVQNSLGEYISFVDSDDNLVYDALELLYNKCQKFDLDIAYGVMNLSLSKDNLRMRTLRHNVDGILNRDEYQAYLFSANCACSSVASISRRSIWTESVYLGIKGAGTSSPNEDVLMNIFASHNVSKCGVFNDIIAYCYNYNPTSTTSTRRFFKQSFWGIYFRVIRENLNAHMILEQYEDLIRISEIDRLTFYVNNIDQNDAWYRTVVSYDCSRYPVKSRISQILIKYPILCTFLVTINRFCKRMIYRTVR